ncbi:hypothetical protein M8J77_016528 [Diaphorina citri]|nr:hypothetical protein M8J77_016528 [Diaphorina citri]
MSTDGSTSKASSSKRGSGNSNAGSDVEEGDTEEESSSSSLQDNLNGTLSSFRIKWKQELDSISNVKNVGDSGDKDQVKAKQKGDKAKHVSIETKAKLLFHQGTEYEQSGKYYDAIQCYKNAMQLVPDIEFRIYSESKQARTLRQEVSSETPEVNGFEEVPSGGEDSNEEEEDEYDGSEDLLVRCQRLLCKHNTFILPAHPQTATHFSALPMEIVIYILRWVMSQHHDARSIDMCSRVCRGLYICARDPAIWRDVSIRTWGLDCSDLAAPGPTTWRQLYLERPRLETTGCYISKTSYLRHGDNSFQDRTHRPWHVVTYFRYLRFFPGGLVLLLTTADVPSSVVGSLKWRTPRDSTILIGHYKMRGDRVFIVAKQSRYNLANARVKTRNRRVNEYETRDQTFHLELKIDTHRHKRNVCLQWQDYSISRTNYLGDTNIDNFDTLGSKFPPFWFSRVKSYTAESDGILEVNF